MYSCGVSAITLSYQLSAISDQLSAIRQNSKTLQAHQITQLHDQPVSRPPNGALLRRVGIGERVAVAGEQHRAGRGLIREQPVVAKVPLPHTRSRNEGAVRADDDERQPCA